MPLYSEEITLIGESITIDNLGNQDVTVEEQTVLCSVKDVGANAFYQAASAGMKPSFIVTVHTFEYQGEQKVRFDNVLYNVIRTYRIDHEETELTCEKVN